MKLRSTLFAVMTLLGTAAAVLVLASGQALADPSESESGKRPYTTDFSLDDCTFVNDDTGLAGNPLWFALIPGNQLTLADDEAEVVVTVCDGTCLGDNGGNGTEVVDGVTTRVIEEQETEDDELKEVSRNFVARCEENNSIVYFGEDVDDYEDGVVVGHEGAWRVGQDDAEAGILMPGQFLLGSRYFQEMAPEIALDRAENAEINLEIEVPLDGGTTYEDCVRVFETSGLHSSDRSEKLYCPGVGLVYDDEIELVDKNF